MATLKTYPCGLRLLNDYIPGRKLAVVSIYVASGSGFDLKGKDGIAHFYEHMFFKSTKTRSAKQILKLLDSFGAKYNAFTSRDKTCYQGVVVLDDVEKFVSVLSDCFFNGVFNEQEIKKEQGVVCSEIDRYNDDLDDCCYELATKHFFEGTNFSHPVLGSKESVTSIAAKDLIEYRKKNNCAQNVIVAITGGVPDNKAEKLVEKYFLPNYKGNNVPTVYKNKELFIPKLGQVYNLQKDTEQVYFNLIKPIIRLEDPRFFKYQFASTMFGQLMSSRLFLRLREKEGLVYSVYSHPSSLAICGMFNIYFATHKSKARQAILALKDEIRKIIENGFSEQEVKHAKKLFERTLIMDDDSLFVRQSSCVSSLLKVGDVYNVEEEIKKLRDFQTKDINKIFGELLKDDNFVVATVSKKDDIDVLKLLK